MAIIHLSNSISAVQKAMQRVCPSCHEKQQVALTKMRQAVPCKKCGASMPPKAQK